jgi:hypothetical protein
MSFQYKIYQNMFTDGTTDTRPHTDGKRDGVQPSGLSPQYQLSNGNEVDIWPVPNGNAAFVTMRFDAYVKIHKGKEMTREWKEGINWYGFRYSASRFNNDRKCNDAGTTIWTRFGTVRLSEHWAPLLIKHFSLLTEKYIIGKWYRHLIWNRTII